jgi:hypothetical protein
MFVEINLNPYRKSVGDCVIRAISAAEDVDWDDTFIDLMVKCFQMKDIPSSNNAWGAYLHDLGYSRHIVPDTCPDCYTIEDFTEDHPKGTYILATGTHVVCVRDGNYFDTWPSGQETVIYYFEKEREDA